MQNLDATSEGLRGYFTKIYFIMALGLFLSGGVSASVLIDSPLQKTMLGILAGFPLGVMGIWLVELLLVVVLSRKKTLSNPRLALAGFVVFSILNGFVISYTLSFYNIGSILQAFFVAGGMFIGMGIVGIVIKKDLTALGQAAIGLLIGVIVMGLLNALVFKSGQMDILITCVTIVVFSGLTAYDHQRIKVSYNTNGNNSGFAIIMALNLYLDFINLFLSILRLTGGGSSD